ncbi:MULTISPECIES: hypothetical protein [unclassified Archaeoglobus]|uniref:hypothetical protein n=1 Tax=unclassified Archaeoglobus TaxID=2643606 RepID=UPI0025C1DBA4|nr:MULTISPECIES: hypothetical protein [unclassified Archaeoglobus]
MEEFWDEVYEAIGEMMFTDKIYVFREIVDEPKTIREIANATGMPYVTVRKYIRWGAEKGLVAVVGTKKVGGAISEKWLMTIIPEVESVDEDNLVIKVKLKIRMRREFCEQVCPFKKDCPVYAEIKSGKDVAPYREIEIEKRTFKGVKAEVCEPLESV